MYFSFSVPNADEAVNVSMIAMLAGEVRALTFELMLMLMDVRPVAQRRHDNGCGLSS